MVALFYMHFDNTTGICTEKRLVLRSGNMSECKQIPQQRYAAKYKKLESVPNKVGYIKQLIRADIAANKAKGTDTHLK